MAMKAGDPVFLDTNVIVYAATDQSPWYRTARNRLTELARAGAQFWISRQVIREFLAATSRPTGLTRALSVQESRKVVEWLIGALRVAEEDAQVTGLLLDLLDHPGAQGKQVHDANIAAIMRRHAIPYLLTHNTDDFARYVPWVKVLPLVP